ncbi:MAG TPA: hypothetical protein VEL79_08900 [Vicinamibacterales bacterium]|nr:hypothetical protein [Vicinamibacterales bacterium]
MQTDAWDSTMRTTLPGLGTEGDANADLPGPLLDDAGHHAKNARARNRDRQNAKQGEDPHVELALRDDPFEQCAVGLCVGGDEIRGRGLNRRANGRRDGP